MSLKEVPTIPKARSGHVAASFGKFMVIWGGYSDCQSYAANDFYMPPDEIWVYHSELNKWHHKRTTGDTPPGLSGSCCVILDNYLYILFGCASGGNTSDVFRVSLLSWKWEKLSTTSSNSPSPRDKLTAWVFKNKIFTFGGYGLPLHGYLNTYGEFFADSSNNYGPRRGWNNQTVSFDPQTCAWDNTACKGYPPSPRAAHASASIDDTVYLFGGRHNEDRLNDLYSLHLPSLTWIKINIHGEIPIGRSWHTLTHVSDKILMLFGGYTKTRQPLGDTWLFNLSDRTWRSIVSSHEYCSHSGKVDNNETLPRLWHTAVDGADGDVLVFGGCCSDILSFEAQSKHTNKVCLFRCLPRSLRNICLDAVYSHKTVLESEWSSLPRSLSSRLYLREPESVDTADTNDNADDVTVCSLC